MVVGPDGVVLRHQVAATVQRLHPPSGICRRGLAPPADKVLGNPPHHPAVEQQVHLVLARLPRVSDRAGRGGSSARSKKGLSRSTLTVGLQRILHGSANV